MSIHRTCIHTQTHAHISRIICFVSLFLSACICTRWFLIVWLVNFCNDSCILCVYRNDLTNVQMLVALMPLDWTINNQLRLHVIQEQAHFA